jgi:hypothetical protein
VCGRRVGATDEAYIMLARRRRSGATGAAYIQRGRRAGAAYT